jgi:peptidoglycan-N-acetylglucosamine deacetylase
MKKAALIAVLLLAAAYGTFTLSRSRTYQLFGTIVSRVETNRKVVALTFDDGPRADTVDEILKGLGGAKVTFFVIGAEIQDNPAAVSKLIAAGHELGNHSWSHERMVFKSSRFIREEFERTDAMIRAAGYRGPIHVRAPYCKKLVGLPRYFEKTNRIHVTWDVEPDTDWFAESSSAEYASYVADHVRPGSIVLMHPWYRGRKHVRDALPLIVDLLEGKGYKFVTVDELLKLRKS